MGTTFRALDSLRPTFLSLFWKKQESKFPELITHMIMNLVGYEKSVIKFGLLIKFTHLKSISYKEGTKTLESTVGNI